MKKFILFLLLAGLALPAVGDNQVTVSGKDKKPVTDIGPEGDDLFPWPSGSEVAFPWNIITGTYVIRMEHEGLYSGHYLQIWITYEGPKERRALHVAQFDRSGRLFATGKGSADRNPKFVTVSMKAKVTGQKYYGLLRGYAKVRSSSYTENDGVAKVVTFCPVRGKKCKEYSNYLLDRLQ